MNNLKIYSLFSGIGGIELGLERAGHQTIGFCESDPYAQAVLTQRFGQAIADNIQTLNCLPKCDVLTAGWPCQDISQVGTMMGLKGTKSSLISEVFRLVRASKHKPQFIILENVAFILHLNAGAVIRRVLKELEALGYKWAYRILDTENFGLPQRRRRMYIVAALDEDPRTILLSNKKTSLNTAISKTSTPCGFYWTEGNTGIGWAIDSVPPLKGGSGLGIPSPPAVWLPKSASFVMPDINSAERLQGFNAGWTNAAETVSPRGARERWKLIGNAVSVPVAELIGERLRTPLKHYNDGNDSVLKKTDKLPKAAWGANGERYSASIDDEGVGCRKKPSIIDYIGEESAALSKRAASGLSSRLQRSSLRMSELFMTHLSSYAA